jgi:tRNA-specific 2-thiouridylase
LRLGPDAVSQIHSVSEGFAAQKTTRSKSCCSIEDSRDAALVAARLDIPYYSMNYEGEFGQIIDRFVDEYNRGRTPIPCVLCNQWLKFGSLREKAKALGCDHIATGHYARLRQHEDGAWQLLRGRDPDKDQSYFLFLMPKESLRDTLFPVGDFAKSEIRDIAREAGLPVAEKADSQEICFVPNDDYREVLRARTPEQLRPGRFVDLSGSVLGDHGGYQNFTIGQRRGTGVALGTPRYVVSIDAKTNTVTLGEREALRKRIAHLSDVQWTSLTPSPPAGTRLRVEAQIRHRHAPRAAEVTVEADNRATLTFDEPQEAITPGQAAVCYDDDVVVGGGWIDRAE